MKKIVVTGEKIGSHDSKIISGAYSDGKDIYSLYTGVMYENDFGIKVIPLNGPYIPNVGEVILGRIIRDESFGYVLDVGSYNDAYLPKRDLDTILKINDIVMVRVTNVNEVKNPSIEFMLKLYRGEQYKINPKKVARVIGKSKSMLNTIQDKSGSRITVGSNGFIYISQGDIELVKRTIDMISNYSHVDNLTEKVEKFMEK